MILDREAENLGAGNRNPTRQHVRLGARRDGTLTAVAVRIEQACGAYRTGGEASDVADIYQTLYRCPNVRTEQIVVDTNTGPAVAFRGPGYVRRIRARARDGRTGARSISTRSHCAAATITVAAVLAGATPLAHNGCKVPLAKVLVRRALTDVTGPLPPAACAARSSSRAQRTTSAFRPRGARSFTPFRMTNRPPRPILLDSSTSRLLDSSTVTCRLPESPSPS